MLRYLLVLKIILYNLCLKVCYLKFILILLTGLIIDDLNLSTFKNKKRGIKSYEIKSNKK